MEFYLSFEQQTKVKENENLVHHILQKKLLILPYYEEYKDDFQVGIIGLMKAVDKFDCTKKVEFASFAYICITNEILMEFRRNRKYSSDLSLDSEINVNKEGTNDGKSLLMVDTIMDRSIKDFAEEMINNEEICESVNIIINCLSDLEKMVMLYHISNFPRRYIAMLMNISENYTSKLIKKCQKKIRKAMQFKSYYKNKYTIEIINYKFKMEISAKDLNENIWDLELFLQGIRRLLKLGEFKITSINGKIIIYFFALEESFLYIAQLINRIENKDSVHKNDIYNVVKQYEQDKKERSNRIKAKVNKDTDSPRGQIRTYILGCTSFTIKQLREKFPNISSGDINSVVQVEKQRSTIQVISKGEYLVVSKKI